MVFGLPGKIVFLFPARCLSWQFFARHGRTIEMCRWWVHWGVVIRSAKGACRIIPRTCKWLITMVSLHPLRIGLGPLPNDPHGWQKWVWSEPLTSPGVILQVGDQLGIKIGGWQILSALRISVWISSHRWGREIQKKNAKHRVKQTLFV